MKKILNIKSTNLIVMMILLVSIQSCIIIKNTVVDEDVFLRDRQNQVSIYDKKSNETFISPFNINTDNMGTGFVKRLMLIEFKSLFSYKAIELQVIEKNGETGGLVIMYYADQKQADIYYTSNLNVSEDMYSNILNKVVYTETDINYYFDQIDDKLQCSLQFTDRFGNKIDVKVNEHYNEMSPVGMLAPIGGEAETPEFILIVYMKDFKFLSQKEKDISVKINDILAEIVKLPFKVNGVSVYQVKYSMNPVTISWNTNYNGVINRYPNSVYDIFKTPNSEIELLNNNGYAEIKRFTGIQNDDKINFRFSPAIPDLQCLSDNCEISGKFSMSINETRGIIAGDYFVTKQKRNIEFIIEPTKGYSPVPGKSWVKKMMWKSLIKEDENHFYQMNSKWHKK